MLSRGWVDEKKFKEAVPFRQDAAVRLLSSLLSYPISLARAWQELQLGRSAVTVCILGARVEAELPAAIWNELSVLTGCEKITLQMIGPEVANEPAARTQLKLPKQYYMTELMDGGRVRVETAREPFERSEVGAALRSGGRATVKPDAFALFNPGLGSAAKYSWGDAANVVLESKGAGVLLTAYDEADAAKDLRWLRLQKGWMQRIGGDQHFEPEQNEWRSDLPCSNVYTHDYYRRWIALTADEAASLTDYEAVEAELMGNRSWPNAHRTVIPPNR